MVFECMREVLYISAGEIDQVSSHLGVDKMQQECGSDRCGFFSTVGSKPNKLKIKCRSKKELKLDLGNLCFVDVDFLAPQKNKHDKVFLYQCCERGYNCPQNNLFFSTLTNDTVLKRCSDGKLLIHNLSSNTNTKRLLLSGDVETNPGPTMYKKINGSKVALMNLRNTLFLNSQSINKCHSFLSEKCTRLTSVSYAQNDDTLHTMFRSWE